MSKRAGVWTSCERDNAVIQLLDKQEVDQKSVFATPMKKVPGDFEQI